MIRKLLIDRTAASAVEFALVLPLLLIFLLGIIDVGRWMWVYNEAQKAAQMGARFAVVTKPVSSAIDADYVGACSPPLTPGRSNPRELLLFGHLHEFELQQRDAGRAGFHTIFDRMHKFLPELRPANVRIEYSASGLGYAGNPNGPDVSLS